MSGITATATPEGHVVITAEASSGTVKLTVTAGYARKLAARLMTLSMGDNAEDDQSFARDIVEQLRRRDR